MKNAENAIASVGSVLADLRPEIGLDAADTPTASEPFDHEAYTRARVREARAERWELQCPSALKTSDWDHPSLLPNREAIERVRSWSADSAKGLLISGATGLGKSRAFWSLLQRLMVTEGREVSVFHSTDFFRDMQEQVNYGRDESAAWSRCMSAVPILALDDFGQEATLSARADWAQAVFMRLLDTRLGEGRPILITTNLGAADLAGGQVNGVRANPLVRRLLDLCEVVKFRAP